MGRTGFIGHKRVFNKEKLLKLLISAIKEEIEDGCNFFTVFTGGEFDRLSLAACRQVRTESDIRIEVVTGENTRRGGNGYNGYRYADVSVSLCNGRSSVLDGCTAVICYVNSNARRCDVKSEYERAVKSGLKVINLYYLNRR